MNIKILLTVLIATASLSSIAREAPPLGGEPREYRLPASTTVALPNDMKVTLVPFGNIPKVTIVVSVAAGNAHEGEHNWLADLTGQMLLEGAADMDSDGLAAAAADMGGEIGVSVSVNQTQAALDVLSEFGADAVALLADVLRRPTLPESELERVRSNLLKNLSISRQQPGTLASQAFRKAIFGDHPYGAGLPDPEAFGALSIEQIQQFHGTQFGAGGGHIYVAGQFDRSAVLQAIRDAFGDWATVTNATLPEPPRRPAPGLTFIERPDAPQSTLYLGLPVVDPSHPDYTALSLMNTLLGGSFSSRVTSNIREDKGYTYSPRSRVSVNKGSGFWVQTADVTTNVTGPAIDEIVNEIERLQTEAPGVDELTRIKNYRIGTFVLGNATRSGLISQLQFLRTHGLGPDHLASFVERLNAITPQEIQRITRDYLSVADMTLVVVGDPATVPAQLESVERISR